MAVLSLISVVMALLIFQWNARSLIANGQELKKVLSDMPRAPAAVCIQESWLVPRLDFVLPGYVGVRCDREDQAGGGCVTFLKDTLAYRRLHTPPGVECVAVEICSVRGALRLVNYYNPCNPLAVRHFNEILGDVGRREVSGSPRS